MKGVYRIYRDDELVCEQENLITTAGRNIILKYLAGLTPLYGNCLVAGTQATAANVADTKLGFEFMRGEVKFKGVEYSTNRVIFKAPMDINDAGKIYEVGMFPSIQSGGSSGFGGQLLNNFDPDLQELSGGTVNTTNVRVGAQSYSVSATASSTTTASNSNFTQDFSGYADTDSFTLAYFINDAYTANIKVRLKVDNSNYFEKTITTSATPGYYTTDWNKSAFVATGSPSWSAIASADFLVTAGSGGTTTVQLDAFRVNDTDVYPDYAFVSHAVLTTPVTKTAGQQMDIEYLLEFNI